jgi:hypothetical protein
MADPVSSSGATGARAGVRREGDRPTIVCLCGSTRFLHAFREANLRETLAGKIVLTVASETLSDAEIFAGYRPEERAAALERLAALHLAKIELADEVLILNVGGYLGESTRRELAYAQGLGKRVRFWEDPPPA